MIAMPALQIPPSVVQPPTILFNPPEVPTANELAALPCPNCDSLAAKTLVLTVDVQLPDNPSKRLRVLHCPACTARFYDSQVPPDYAEPALNNRGRVPFYVQQGAGVSLITRPLAQLRQPPGSTYMEVGCGYGFGLDFALNTNGWAGIGIDPAPLAALGRDALNLPIELRYLRDDDEARGTVDVVMGSEVIEHVTSPKAFVRTLRAMLKPDGVLVLTTPNGDDIDPATPSGIIVPLLSPSLHLVIQNRHSLRTLLQQSGFAYVDVVIDSHSLVAYASDIPLDLETSHTALRHALRQHLERRAHSADPAGDPFLGFAGRAFTESMNDGDLEAADRAWALLVPACRARYGISLDAITALPKEIDTCSLEEMARLVPLNLGGLLYARAIRHLAAGTPRPALEALFLLAAKTCDAMRRALGELAMEDGQTEDIAWTALAEAVLCACQAGSADAANRLANLPPAPSGGAARKQEIALRAMSNLVNAGQYAPARYLVDLLKLDHAPFVQPEAPLSEQERDALFCLAVLDINIGPNGETTGNPVTARSRLQRVRATCPPGGGLWWASLRAEAQALNLLGDTEGVATLAERAWAECGTQDVGLWAVTTLCNAGHHDSARQLASQAGLASAPFSQPGSTRPLTESERDAVFALAILDVQPTSGRQRNEPAMARGRFARVRAFSPAGSGLWLAALRGELQALDQLDAMNEAATLTADVEAAYPEIQLPPDVLTRIGKA